MVRLARSCEKCLFDLPTPDPRDPGVTYFTPPQLKPQRVSPNALCARVQAASSPSWHDIGLLRLVLLADLRLARALPRAPMLGGWGGLSGEEAPLSIALVQAPSAVVDRMPLDLGCAPACCGRDLCRWRNCGIERRPR